MKMMIKWMIPIFCMVFLFAGAVSAATMYVTDILKLPLRSGPSTEHKILALKESGEKLEVLEASDEWSLVRAQDGKEGYVSTRYLLSEPISRDKLAQLQQIHQELTTRVASLAEENKRLKSENQVLGADLSVNEKDFIQLQSEFKALEKDSAGFLELKSKYDKAATELVEKTQRLEVLEEELAGIELSQYIKWFLAGAGVLFVGFIVGFSTKRQRRRSSLL
jgi:SH3 domain protein